jgi:amino acid transporter
MPRIKILKQLLATLVLVILFAPNFVLAIGTKVQLDLLNKNTIIDIQDQGDRSASAFGNKTNETTLTQYVADILNVFFGLLATIFIVLIVYAGYTWMTAAGNAEKVTRAQGTIKVAIIGIIIIASAYAITYFLFARLPDSSQ